LSRKLLIATDDRGIPFKTLCTPATRRNTHVGTTLTEIHNNCTNTRAYRCTNLTWIFFSNTSPTTLDIYLYIPITSSLKILSCTIAWFNGDRQPINTSLHVPRHNGVLFPAHNGQAYWLVQISVQVCDRVKFSTALWTLDAAITNYITEDTEYTYMHKQ